MRRIIVTLALAIVALSPCFAQSPKNDKADSIIGEYLVPDKKNGDSKVRFTKNQAGTYDCQVFWIAQPIDPATGKPWLDSKNPDKSLRNVRCDQLYLIRGLQYNASKKLWDGAIIYDPNRGIKAKVSCKFVSDKYLEVKGSVLGISESLNWEKLK